MHGMLEHEGQTKASCYNQRLYPLSFSYVDVLLVPCDPGHQWHSKRHTKREVRFEACESRLPSFASTFIELSTMFS